MKAQIVSFHCVLKDKTGQIISSTFNRDIITGVEGNSGFLRELAKGLENLRKGEKRKISLSAEQAYGFYDPRLVIRVPKKRFGDNELVCEGSEVVSQGAAGELKVFRVVQATDKAVILDGNHPLAGRDLVFEIEATDARDATNEEIAESVRTSSKQKETLH